MASYNEPFAGSLAVLLDRPATHEHRIETVNDLDAYLANFWRALLFAPDEVAYWADFPVNETDLHARHRWLVQSRKALASMARVRREPDYFDAKIAGWWVWGQCLWIGSGWCQQPDWTGRANAGRRARGINVIDELPQERSARNGNGQPGGVRRQFDRNGAGTAHQQRRPHLSGEQGINVEVKRPKLRARGDDGIPTRRWQGGGAGGGSGVHAPSLSQKMPSIGVREGRSCGGGRGIFTQEIGGQKPYLASGGGLPDRGVVTSSRSDGLYAYLHALAVRLRRVRVCCGDWKRVLTPSVTTYIGVTGVFLDPPYDHDLRERCYSEDHNISGDVRQWAIEHGDDPNMRIALCGYEGEHAMPDTWECVAWKANGGYSRTVRGRANRERERIWFSPHCLRPELPLFAGAQV